jgi:hypothetical protein
MNRHTDRPALAAPARIYATVNGARISLPGMTQHLVGGWEDSPGPRTTEYVRADLVGGLKDALDACEAAMSIVEPRSSKAQYLEVLGQARAALEKAGAS